MSRAPETAPGLLRIVATPLGNLGDLSSRAREALETADAIAAEDTRRAGRLLQLLELPRKPLLSYFAPQESRKAGPILDRLQSGQTIVLVTDGGTPGVSDPGAILIRRALEAGIRIEPVPGPSAVTTALSVSPAGADRFVFDGFLPSRPAARRKRLRELTSETRTLVFYEAPHRLPACLRDLVEIFGAQRRGTIVREATKAHEEILEGTLTELSSRYASTAKGEAVLVIEGGEKSQNRIEIELTDLLALTVRCGLTAERGAREVAEVTGVPRSRLVRLARKSPSP